MRNRSIPALRLRARRVRPARDHRPPCALMPPQSVVMIRDMKKTVFFVIPLLIAVAFFIYLPVVETGRNIIPEAVYKGKECGCICMLESRPWYSKLNYWFWLWIAAVPILILSLKTDIHKWKKIFCVIGIIAVSYGLINLSVQLMWDIRGGSFVVSTSQKIPWQKTWDMPDCASIADGASLSFTLFFGWIPAGAYAVIWLLIAAILRTILRTVKRWMTFTQGL